MKKHIILFTVTALSFLTLTESNAQSKKITPALKKMIDTFYASFSNPALLDEVLDKGFVDHMPFKPDSPAGIEGFRKTVAAYNTIFSDFAFEFKGIYVDGEKVVVRSVVTAKHTGEFLGIKPTNKTVSWNAIDIYTVKNNKMIEGWHVESFLGTYLSMLKKAD